MVGHKILKPSRSILNHSLSVLTICLAMLVGFSNLAFAQVADEAYFSVTQKTVEFGTQVLDVAVNISTGYAYSSADLALKIEGDAKVTKITSQLGPKATLLGPLEKNGLVHFGFYSDKNQFSGQTKVAIIQLTIQGQSPVTVSLQDVSTTALDPNVAVVKKAIAVKAPLVVTRALKPDGTGTNTPGGSGSNPPANAGNNTAPVQPPVNHAGTSVLIDDNQLPLGNVPFIFVDIEKHWANNYIQLLASFGVIRGTTENTFSPELRITRGDFTKLLMGVIDQKVDAPQLFKDVKPGDYYYEAIQSAQKLGLVTGVNGLFNPKDTLTRQDMMVMLHRAMTLKKVPMLKAGNLSGFSDQQLIAPYARQAVAALIGEGIVQGYNGKLKPLDTLTRAEAAKVIHNLRELFK